MDGCRVLGGLFYFGHVHGEDLYGRTIRELNEDPRFHKRDAAGASSLRCTPGMPESIRAILGVRTIFMKF